jgi:pSer/pThr/pTyr-binding forkhead associated (FHA) protein
MAHSYALRFISGKYQGGEFPLLPDRELVVGRSSDLDMVLVEDMVSRKHAKIATHNSQLVIQDLGSTNGTFVNGEKIKKTRLKEGDRILIGTSILKVIATKTEAKAGDETEAKKSLEARGQKQAADQQRSQMSGSLEDVPVPDLLQLFSTSKRTGVLHIKSPLGYGKIYLRNGNVFYASIDDDHDLGPMKALCRIVGWEKGNFELGRPEEETNFVLELEDPTEALLMEALRQLDEFRRIAEGLPESHERLALPMPLEQPLSALKPVELDVMQLVYNHNVTQLVFDKSAATDFETAQALLSLLSQGYIIRE